MFRREVLRLARVEVSSKCPFPMSGATVERVSGVAGTISLTGLSDFLVRPVSLLPARLWLY